MKLNYEAIALAKQCQSLVAEFDLQAILRKVQGRELVLFVGATGSGKSTLINNLLGTCYQRHGVLGFDLKLKPIEGTVKEVAHVGNSTVVSDTLFPQVFELKNTEPMLCDLSGFGDTRSNAQTIIGSLLAERVVKAAKGVKKIIFTIDANAVVAGRGSGLNGACSVLQKILPQNNKLDLEACTYLVTKLPSGVVKADFIKEYIVPKSDQLNQAANNRELTDAEIFRLKFCQHIIAHPDQLILADAADQGATKNLLAEIIRKPSKLLGSINILQQEMDAVTFVEQLQAVIDTTIASDRKVRELPARQQQCLSVCNSLLSPLHKNRENLDFQYAKASSDKSVTEEKIKNCKRQIMRCEETLISTQSTISVKQVTLKSLLDAVKIMSNDMTQEEVSKSNFQCNGQTEQYLAGHHKKKNWVGHVTRRTPYYNTREKSGSGSHPFRCQSGSKICRVTLNGNDIPKVHYPDDYNVSYDYVYPYGKGGNAVLRIYSPRNELQVTKDLIMQHNKTIAQLTKEIKDAEKSKDVQVCTLGDHRECSTKLTSALQLNEMTITTLQLHREQLDTVIVNTEKKVQKLQEDQADDCTVMQRLSEDLNDKFPLLTVITQLQNVLDFEGDSFQNFVEILQSNDCHHTDVVNKSRFFTQHNDPDHKVHEEKEGLNNNNI